VTETDISYSSTQESTPVFGQDGQGTKKLAAYGGDIPGAARFSDEA
jgi:hypothetical protein